MNAGRSADVGRLRACGGRGARGGVNAVWRERVALALARPDVASRVAAARCALRACLVVDFCPEEHQQRVSAEEEQARQVQQHVAPHRRLQRVHLLAAGEDAAAHCGAKGAARLVSAVVRTQRAAPRRATHPRRTGSSTGGTPSASSTHTPARAAGCAPVAPAECALCVRVLRACDREAARTSAMTAMTPYAADMQS
jgi:hypothetical protein